MTNNDIDYYLERVKQAKNCPAVQKAKISALRAYYPRGIIFAVEGPDDKQAYFQWVKQINSALQFEFHICNNKDQLLQLFDTMCRDKSDISNNIFYLIDRDFTDLKGRKNNGTIYMTETYAIENQLITECVLDKILLIDLHCHSEPKTRSEIISLFNTQYDCFLDATKLLNYKLFLARKCNIKILNEEEIPAKISKIANIELTQITPLEKDPSLAVNLEREPSDAERLLYEPEFSCLSPRQHYRGKFAMLFFKKWLSLLTGARNKKLPPFFNCLTCDIDSDFVAAERLQIDALAGKSIPAEAFRTFINNSVATSTSL